MQITTIGINGDGSRLNGSLETLKRDLAYFQECGYGCVELASTGLDVYTAPPHSLRSRGIAGGHLHAVGWHKE